MHAYTGFDEKADQFGRISYVTKKQQQTVDKETTRRVTTPIGTTTL